MTEPSLPDFLQKSNEEGTFDSASEFTVNKADALAKLGQFQLERQEFWLLKMVQFANLVQADSIEFKLGRRQTTVVLKGELGVQPQGLYAEAISQPASRHPLHVALRSLAVQKGLRFQLETTESVERVAHPDQATPLNTQELSEPGLRLSVERPSLSLFGLKDAIKRNRDELNALTEFCWTSPVPVSVDGRPVRPKLGAPGHGVETPKGGPPPFPISLIRAFVPRFEGRPELCLSQPDLKEFQRLPTGGSWQVYVRKEWFKDEEQVLCQLKPGVKSGAHLSIVGTAALSVQFCCLGVLVDGVTIPHQAPANTVNYRQGLQLILPIDLEETDLGGFRVRDSQNLAHQGLLSTASYFLEVTEIYRTLRNYFKLPFMCHRSSWRRAERVSSFGIGLVTTLTTGVATGGVLPTLGGLVASASIGSQIPNYFRWNLRLLFTPVLKVMAPFRESLLYQQAALQRGGVRGWLPTRRLPLIRPDGWNHWPDGPPFSAGSWAVKLIQAAVAWSCPKIEFTFLRDEVRVAWSQDPDLQSDDLFHGQDQGLEKGMTHFRAALVSLISHPVEALEVGRMHWNSEDFSNSVASRGRKGLRVTLAPPDSSNLVSKMRQRIRQQSRFRLDAIRKIQEEAWLAPCSVRIDGQPLESGYGRFPRGMRETFQETIYWRLPLCLARLELPQRAGRPILPRPQLDEQILAGETWLDGKLTLPATLLTSRLPSEEPLGAIVTLTGGLRADSAVEFVHDGVLVDRQPLYHPDDFQTVEEMKPGLPGRGCYPHLCLRLFVPVCDEDLNGEGLVRDRWALCHRYLADLEPLERVRDALLQRLPSMKYRFPAEALGEPKEDSGFAYRLEAQARYRLFKGRHKSALKTGLETLPTFLRWLAEGAKLPRTSLFTKEFLSRATVATSDDCVYRDK